MEFAIPKHFTKVRRLYFMRKVFPILSKKFGDRLNALMKYNNLTPLDLAIRLCGYQSKPKSNTNEYLECSYRAKTIRNHLKLGELAEISTSKSLSTIYLADYCNYFKCSADYFFGYIDYPTYEETDIGETTGLSKISIETLKSLNLKNGSTQSGHNEISTLNVLLSDFLCTVELLNGIEDFLNVRYNIPVYHTGKTEVISGIIQPQCLVPNNEYDMLENTYLLTLARDKNNLNDNYSIPLTDVFLESIALKTVEKAVIELRSFLNDNNN